MDGGREYLKRSAASWADFEELSEYEKDTLGERAKKTVAVIEQLAYDDWNV